MVSPRSLFSPPLFRLRVTPDEPAEGPPATVEQRPCGSRRPHIGVTVAKVRQLIEQTDLTYSEITARTGVGRASISRWARDGAWRRPAHAPRPTDMVPVLRAGRQLKLRKLATRLEAQARRCVRELEQAPQVDVATLMQALQVLRLVQLEAQGRRGRRRWTGPAITGAARLARDEAIRTALTEMRSASFRDGPKDQTGISRFRIAARTNPAMVIPRSLFAPTIVRLRVTPDEPVEGPPAITEQRPRGSRRPHTDMAVAKVKHLIEHTGLSYSEITARTGVGRASISRWARDGAWQRPAHAPRATNMVPASRAGRRLKLRKLGIRLEAMANRHVCELEQAPRIEVEQVMQALQVLKMARLQAMGRRGRRHRATDRVTSGAWRQARDNAVNTALKEMRRGGVDLDRAPKEALDMLIEANEPVEEHPALRERRSRRRW